MLAVNPLTMSVARQDQKIDNGQEQTMNDEQNLTPSDIFHILQNDRRRLVLRYLQGRQEPVRMRDIAEQVAAWEHDTTVEALTSKQRQRVYIPLYQSHLPKLAEAGIINYEQSRGIVERTPLADLFDPYLDVEAGELHDHLGVGRSEEKWDDYYVGVSVIGAVIVLGAIIELPGLATMSGLALALTILVLFTVLTVGRHIAKHA